MAIERAKYEAKPWPDAAPVRLELAPDVVIGGKYRLVRPAGFGGMGTVWVARNQATDAEVAIKALLAEDAVSEEVAARFRREAHAAAKLSHRGIVRIFDLVELDGANAGALVMVMELLHGETLAEVFDKRSKLDEGEAVDIALELLSALSHAHAAGIVHRDLKPENVFLSVDPDGHKTPKLVDFGISKLNAPEAPRITGDGALLGTPSYMSPEQARGSRDVDARSDLFSMGILLYEMLAGKNPFSHGSYHSVVAAILEREPERIPGLSDALWHAVSKSLRKRPEGRYQNADALATALRAAREGRPFALSLPAPSASSTVEIAPDEPHPADLDTPSRKFQATVMNEQGIAKRSVRAQRAAALVLGAALALGLTAYAASRVQKQVPPPAAAATVKPPPPRVAPIPPPIPAPVPVIAVSALPVVTTPPSASPPANARVPGAARPRQPRSSAAPPPPPPPPAPAPDPKPPSPVVRDPGF